MNSRPITIVGCGQAGSSIAYHCLQRGYPVRILDARAEPSVKQNQQIPWGWYRKISLQSSLKRRLTTPDFPFPEWTGHINQTNGPMLITTKNDSVVHQWKRWCEECEGTDARIVTPANAEQEFHLSADYFAHHGGVFVCDSRDYLIDFNALNTQLWEYFDAHPDCEWVKGCRVGRVTTHPESGRIQLHTTQGTIPSHHTLFTVGNQSSSLFPEQPIVQIRLPYATVHQPADHKYISLWNKDSSVLFYNDGTTKIACGVQSAFDLSASNWSTLHHFMAMGIRGWSNLNLCTTNEVMMRRASRELSQIGVDVALDDEDNIEWCNVDVTPNLCPYIYLPISSPCSANVLSVSGLSGSGTMVLDSFLVNKIINSVIDGRLDKDLEPFHPAMQTLYSSWFPPKDKQTPLSSIV